MYYFVSITFHCIVECSAFNSEQKLQAVAVFVLILKYRELFCVPVLCIVKYMGYALQI